MVEAPFFRLRTAAGGGTGDSGVTTGDSYGRYRYIAASGGDGELTPDRYGRSAAVARLCRAASCGSGGALDDDNRCTRDRRELVGDDETRRARLPLLSGATHNVYVAEPAMPCKAVVCVKLSWLASWIGDIELDAYVQETALSGLLPPAASTPGIGPDPVPCATNAAQSSVFSDPARRNSRVTPKNQTTRSMAA